MDWKALLSDGPVRLRYVQRYSNCRRVHFESVAEHSYYVVMYATLLAKGLDGIDHQSLYEGCVYHDFEELASGDVLRTLKKFTVDLNERIDHASDVLLMEVLTPMMPNHVLSWIFQNKDKKKRDRSSVEGRIIFLADYLSVVSYLYQEHLAGNRDVVQHKKSVRQYHEMFTHSEFDQWRDAIDGVEHLVNVLCQ
jgi:5'-deoxynucleotidase YfbR-like HD superfamily hydrolase